MLFTSVFSNPRTSFSAVLAGTTAEDVSFPGPVITGTKAFNYVLFFFCSFNSHEMNTYLGRHI